MSKNMKGILLSFGSVIIMALTPVMNKLSLSSLTPIQASFLNAFFSTIFTLIFVLMSRKKVKWVTNKYLLMIGVLNTLGILLQYYSSAILDPVTIGLLGRFYIVFAVILSFVILKEPMKRSDALPILMTILGSFVIAGVDGDFSNILGVVGAVSYTFFFALTNILAKKGLEKADAQIVLLYNQLISSILLLLVMLFTGQGNIQIGSGVSTVFISALCSGFVGLLLFYESLKYISFRNSNLIRTSSPIFVFLLSIPFLPVHLTINLLVGGGLIIVSVFLMNIHKGES